MKSKIILLGMIASVSFGQFIPIPDIDSGSEGGYPKDAEFDSIIVDGIDVTNTLGSLTDLAFTASYNDLSNNPVAGLSFDGNYLNYNGNRILGKGDAPSTSQLGLSKYHLGVLTFAVNQGNTPIRLKVGNYSIDFPTSSSSGDTLATTDQISGKLSKTGDTATGNYTFKNGSITVTGNISVDKSDGKISVDKSQLSKSQLIIQPADGHFLSLSPSGGFGIQLPNEDRVNLSFPKKSGIIATTNDIITYTAGTGISIDTNNVISLDAELNPIYQPISDVTNFVDSIEFDLNNPIVWIDMTGESGIYFDDFSTNPATNNIADGSYIWEVLVKTSTATFTVDVDSSIYWIDKTQALSSEGLAQGVHVFVARLIKKNNTYQWMLNYSYSY